MKKWLIICAAAVQVLAVSYMAADRELVLHTGRTVYLRTAPVDPRDVFRGDYVQLDYEVSHIPDNLISDTLRDLIKADTTGFRRPLKVFAVLKTEGDLAEVERLTDTRPAGGIFIRGSVGNDWRGANYVRYGIEAFFVQQKTGLDIERGRSEDGIQVPLEMEVAIGRQGTAVIKGYRWSRLGIGMSSDRDTNGRIRTATIMLRNNSSNDIAIVDLPGAASLSLVEDSIRWHSEATWKWVGEGRSVPAVTENDVKTLKPGEVHSIRVDLTDPAWFVATGTNSPSPVSQHGWSPMFRLVYRPPSAAACAHLPDADKIWHGHLLSSAFNGGRTD